MGADGLRDATVEELQVRMATDRLSAEEIAWRCVERIAESAAAPDGYNAVLEVNPDALAIAASLDRERRLGTVRGPLHGIPVLLKDNIDTGDRMHTSAGSLALADSYAAQDASLVRRLRQAGAVILGKANLTEWANFMTAGMPNGYSSRGGQVRNPYGPYDVGGSSSGSAAAVAADLVPLAVGTETSGSILSPAGQNSVVGIKPTVGLVSRTGIVPISWSQDTAGPLARTVADAALLLRVLAGEDPLDVATVAHAGRETVDYSLDRTALQGSRIGVPRGGYADRLDDERSRVFEQALDALRKAGAAVVDPVVLPPGEDGGHEVLLYEFQPALNAYLSRLGPGSAVHSLRELVAYNAADPERMLRYGQTVLLEAEAKSGRLCEAEYVQARLRDLRRSRAEGIDRALSHHALDALVFPGAFGSAIAAKAGYPSVSVPGGYTAAGQPVGIAFTGPAFSEPRLIALAHAFEQATQLRRPTPGPFLAGV